jgi:hypothetical protein
MCGGALLALLVACGAEDAEQALSDGGSGSVADASADAAAASMDAATPDASMPVVDGAPGDARAEDAVSDAGSDARTADADASRDAAPAGDGATSCPFAGHIDYALARATSPSADQSSAYALITAAMDGAIAKYNCYTDITRSLRVSYDPAVATADGNVNGSIRFGARGNMTLVAAMHEISHVLGVGSNEFRAKVQNGVFTGARATAQLREISGSPDDVLHSDGTHMWPHGLNYPSEYKSELDAVNHCKLVVAVRADLNP